MKTKHITEGGILSALQIVLGLILIPTGIGYSLYVEMILPITMALIYLRCGRKISMIAGFNTLLLVAFGFGNIGIAVYAFQGLGIGFLTGYVLEKNQGVQDDLILESLMGCLFVLILDLLTAHILGYSLLDDDGITEMVLEMIPGADANIIQSVYYLSIASVPVAAVLVSYIGTIVLGYRLGLRQTIIKEKYHFMKYYKELVPFSYQGKRMAKYTLLGLIINGMLWPYVSQSYLKAWIACSSAILAYFSLMDLSKLIGQFIVERYKRPILLLGYHFVLLYAFLNAFWWTCWSILIIGTIIDLKTSIREEQEKQLVYFSNQLKLLKKNGIREKDKRNVHVRKVLIK
ncbi:MAG: hypothetical protein J6F30_14050 [Cellulosilyticum sp.]|nr:hypothetical protein [Cellulosilyticum sp.]